MTLYLDARTNCSDLMVDFIEVQLSNGEVVSLNWDESEIDVMMPDLVPDTRESTSMKSTPMDGWMIFGK